MVCCIHTFSYTCWERDLHLKSGFPRMTLHAFPLSGWFELNHTLQLLHHRVTHAKGNFQTSVFPSLVLFSSHASAWWGQILLLRAGVFSYSLSRKEESGLDLKSISKEDLVLASSILFPFLLFSFTHFLLLRSPQMHLPPHCFSLLVTMLIYVAWKWRWLWVNKSGAISLHQRNNHLSLTVSMSGFLKALDRDGKWGVAACLPEEEGLLGNPETRCYMFPKAAWRQAAQQGRLHNPFAQYHKQIQAAGSWTPGSSGSDFWL